MATQTALALLLAQPAAPEQAWTPADAVRAAAADAMALPKDRRYHARYLTLAAVPLKERAELIQVLSGHVNGWGRRTRIIAPAVVSGTNGRLLRLDLDRYGSHLTEVWERLKSPYEHVEVITDWPGGVWYRDGQYYAAGAFRWKRQALAPWLSEGPGGKEALAVLVAATESKAPLVSAQWFLWQTAVQEGRGDAGYYDFLGVKDQAGFEKLLRFDAKLAKDLEQRRVVIFSGVTQEPRRVERTQTVLGGLWRTFDSAVATDKSNPLRVLNGGLEFDVTEQIGVLPNGMPAFLLANSKGVRQDKAPDNIVAGDRASHKDGRLHVNLSCIRCHYAGKADMILDIRGAPVKKIAAVDYKKLEELADLYLRDLAPAVAQDRQGYAAAVKLATGGMTTAQYGTAYGRAYQRYDEAKVDLTWAARQFGCHPNALESGLMTQERAGAIDPVASVLLSGDAIPIRQFEEIQLSLYGAVQGGKR